MCVSATVFGVQDAGAFLVLDREFVFEVAQKDTDGLRVVVANVRVNVNVPDRAVSPPVAGTEDKLPKLPGQSFGGQVASGDKLHVLPGLAGEQVPRQGRATLSPGFTGKHGKGLVIASRPLIAASRDAHGPHKSGPVAPLRQAL